MAKLVRQKSTAGIGPVGVVRMTGLRSQAEAWAETGKAADKLTTVFTDELGEDRKRQANEDWAAYLKNPETNLHGALHKNAKGEAMYIADSDGVPTELPPQMQQKKRMDEGIFSNSYTKEINRLANDHNKNLATNDIRSFLDGQYAAQEATKQWNPSAFNQATEAYMNSALERVSPAVQAEVLNDATARKSLLYNNIHQNALLETQKKAIASKERLVQKQTGEARDALANSALGLQYDMGLQRQLTTAIQNEMELSKFKNEDDLARGKRIDDLNMLFANGQIQGQVTMLASDEDGFTADDNIKMARYLDGLVSGQSKIMGVTIDENGVPVQKEMTVGELIPNLDDRQRLYGNLSNVIKTKRDLWIAEEQIYTDAQTDIITDLQSQLNMAVADGNAMRIQELTSEIVEWQSGLKGNNASELSKLGSISYLFAKKNFAAANKDLIQEGYAKGLASINNQLLQQLMPEQVNLYTEMFRLSDEEHQQALRDGGWDNIYADQKKKYETLKSLIAANKKTDKEMLYQQGLVDEDFNLDQTKANEAIIEKRMNVAAGGVYRALQDDGTGVSWERDWSIIGPDVSRTKVVPPQLRGRISAAFENKDGIAIVNAARLVMEMRENGVPIENIRKGIGDNAYIGINEVIKKLTTKSEVALSDDTLQRALNFYNPETRPTMKWDSELKRETDKKLKTAHEGTIFDDPEYPPKMQQDLEQRIKLAIQEGEATTVDDAFAIAKDEIIDKRNIWGRSDYGMSGNWTKYPIEKAFSGFSGQQLNRHIRQALLDTAGNMVRIGTGEEVNLLTDFDMPETADFFDVGGEFGYMEKLREAQIASKEGGYKLAFSHVRGTGANSVYRAMVRTADGSLQQVYTPDGREVEVDLTKTYSVFNDGKQASNVIDAQIKDLEAKYSYLDNYPLHLGSVAAPGYASDQRLEKVREWQEVKEDIAALKQIKERVDRATDIVDDVEIMAFAGENIITEIQKIRNEITSMPVEEYKAFDSLEREGKLNWMRERGLLME